MVNMIQTSAAEASVGRRHRESRRGLPQRHGTGPCMHRASTEDLPPLIMEGGLLEIQQDGNVRGALRLTRIYLKEYIFDRYLTRKGR